ncbi:hypothetical protein ACTWPT_55450 [Nonomuraea sp. 3N208]
MALVLGVWRWTIAESLGLDVRAALGDVRAPAYGAVVTLETC